MGNTAGGLEQQETSVGVEDVDSSSAGLAQQAFMIERRIGGEQGETEAVLALDCAMTGAAVATETTEEGNDVTAEPRLRRRFRGMDGTNAQEGTTAQCGQAVTHRLASPQENANLHP